MQKQMLFSPEKKNPRVFPMTLFPAPRLKKYRICNFNLKSKGFQCHVACGNSMLTAQQDDASLRPKLCSQASTLYNSSLKPFCVSCLALSSSPGASHVKYTFTGSMFQCL